MGFIRFVPKHEKYTFDGDLNEPSTYEYEEFIFNSSELIRVMHSYDSRLYLEDHPRDENRAIYFIMKCRGSEINSYNFLVIIPDTVDNRKYEFFIKNLFDDINIERPITIEYDSYHFG